MEKSSKMGILKQELTEFARVVLPASITQYPPGKEVQTETIENRDDLTESEAQSLENIAFWHRLGRYYETFGIGIQLFSDYIFLKDQDFGNSDWQMTTVLTIGVYVAARILTGSTGEVIANNLEKRDRKMGK